MQISLHLSSQHSAPHSERFPGTGPEQRAVLHVQSVSAWAPACIGPYAQAAVGGGMLYMAGQIGLDPASMQLVPGGAAAEVCALHVALCNACRRVSGKNFKRMA